MLPAGLGLFLIAVVSMTANAQTPSASAAAREPVDSAAVGAQLSFEHVEGTDEEIAQSDRRVHVLATFRVERLLQ